MATLFSRIVSGEIPAYKITETPDFLAFLDIMPLEKGHTLVIPKKESDYIFAIGDAEYSGLWDFTRNVAKAVESAIPCKRIGIAVIGLEVPHTHIHLIPLQTNTINFTLPKLKLDEGEMQEIAARIRDAYSKL